MPPKNAAPDYAVSIPAYAADRLNAMGNPAMFAEFFELEDGDSNLLVTCSLVPKEAGMPVQLQNLFNTYKPMPPRSER